MLPSLMLTRLVLKKRSQRILDLLLLHQLGAGIGVLHVEPCADPQRAAGALASALCHH